MLNKHDFWMASFVRWKIAMLKSSHFIFPLSKHKCHEGISFRCSPTTTTLYPNMTQGKKKKSLEAFGFWGKTACWSAQAISTTVKPWHCRWHHTCNELCQEIQDSHHSQILIQPFHANLEINWKKKLERWQHGHDTEGLTLPGKHPA